MKAADRGEVKIKNTLFSFFIFILSLPLAAQDKTINLMISEHHVDHLGFFFRYGERYGVPYGSARPPATMIVLDAHADTVKNERDGFIRQFAAARDFWLTVDNAGNHNWIHPLAPVPLVELVWISAISGRPRADKLQGFERSVASWGKRVNAYALSVEELSNREVPERTLFISVDLDFFYSEYYSLREVPAVLDALFAFSSRSRHPVVWAFCLSRPWLPNDDYAWALLEQTLRWLNSHPEFRAPEITLFEGGRFDTSHTAQAFRAEGREMPFMRESDAPEQVTMLLWELEMRDWD
jgi:hypothetical protein